MFEQSSETNEQRKGIVHVPDIYRPQTVNSKHVTKLIPRFISALPSPLLLIQFQLDISFLFSLGFLTYQWIITDVLTIKRFSTV